MSSGVQVTGLGVVSSAGEDMLECMQTMCAGKRDPQAPALFEVDIEEPFPVFEVNCDLPYADNPGIIRSNRLLFKAVEEALNNAKLDVPRQKKARIGVCLGTTVACTLNNEPYYRSYRKGETPDFSGIEPYLKNNPALFLSKRLGCNGPVATIANACSSGTDAIGTAMHWLMQDLCDVVIAGGTDELCRTSYLGFASLQVMSPQPCRPFDAERRGLNLGEGAGIVIMEREKYALKRDAEVLANICGYGTCLDAYHITAPHPKGTGLRKAIDFAFRQARLDYQDISFINAHGTSTITNDQVEGNVICDLFGKDIPVVSTKAYTGHTLGAAGGLEAAFTICSLLDAKLPGTAGFKTFDPKCGLEPVTKTMSVQKGPALSLSLAFGGTNSALLIKGAA
jgi:3-oxoacyl-(acyl-carrier-protein) synthase